MNKILLFISLYLLNGAVGAVDYPPSLSELNRFGTVVEKKQEVSKPTTVIAPVAAPVIAPVIAPAILTEVAPYAHLLQVGGGNSFTSFEQKATGISYSTDYKYSPDFWFDYTASRELSTKAINVFFLHQKTSFKEPRVLGTKSVSIERNYVALSTGLWRKNFPEGTKWDVDFGAAFQHQKTGAFSQYVLVPSMNYAGPLFTTQFYIPYNNSRFSSDIKLSFIWGASYHEKSLKSGDSSFHFESQIFLREYFQMTPKWKFTFGALLIYEELNFNGTSERQATNARDRQETFSFPVGVEYVF
jgi:hypothetical protein